MHNLAIKTEMWCESIKQYRKIAIVNVPNESSKFN